jgi:DNA-directed RNA polymerase subunit L
MGEGATGTEAVAAAGPTEATAPGTAIEMTLRGNDMEMRTITRTESTLEIEFPTENDTFLNLLKQKLLRDEKVVNATYVIGHPLLDKPKLVLEVSDKKPDLHLRNAAKELRQAFDEFETQLLRQTQ